MLIKYAIIAEVEQGRGGACPSPPVEGERTCSVQAFAPVPLGSVRWRELRWTRPAVPVVRSVEADECWRSLRSISHLVGHGEWPVSGSGQRLPAAAIFVLLVRLTPGVRLPNNRMPGCECGEGRRGGGHLDIAIFSGGSDCYGLRHEAPAYWPTSRIPLKAAGTAGVAAQAVLGTARSGFAYGPEGGDFPTPQAAPPTAGSAKGSPRACAIIVDTAPAGRLPRYSA